MTTYEKAKFRKTSEWKDFRENFRETHLDELSGKALKPSYVLHHSDLNPNNYTDLSNEDLFMGFNTSYEHRLVHYLYTRFLSDPHILLRLSDVITKMAHINKFRDIKDYKKQKTPLE